MFAQQVTNPASRGFQTRDDNGGGSAPAHPQVKQMIEQVMQGFTDFRKANDDRLAALEKGFSESDHHAKLDAIQGDLAKALDLKSEIEHLEAKFNRQRVNGGGDAGMSPEQTEYRDAFINGFVRKGREDGLKDLAVKAHQVGVDADGGFAVPEIMDSQIHKVLREQSAMRTLCRVITVGTTEYKKLVNTGGVGSGWVGETDTRPETATSQMQEWRPVMGEIYANPQVTQTALDDLMYDVEGELAQEIAEEFAIRESEAFISGNGTKKPKGFLDETITTQADGARAFGTLQAIKSGVAGDFAANPNASLIFYDVVASLKSAYRPGARWVMGKRTMFDIMKMVDGEGRYLWQPTLQAGTPIVLVGYGITEDEYMPSKADLAYPVAFGDFKRGYWIVDRFGIRSLRDPYTNKPNVGFYTTKRVGGKMFDSEAIKLIQLAV